MINHLVRLTIVLGFVATAVADGPKDNLPDQVRRIPRLGIEVPDEKRKELESGLGRLQELMDQLQELATVDRLGCIPERCRASA